MAPLNGELENNFTDKVVINKLTLTTNSSETVAMESPATPRHLGCRGSTNI